jgi:hypothetical protein
MMHGFCFQKCRAARLYSVLKLWAGLFGMNFFNFILSDLFIGIHKSGEYTIENFNILMFWIVDGSVYSVDPVI